MGARVVGAGAGRLNDDGDDADDGDAEGGLLERVDEQQIGRGVG